MTLQTSKYFVLTLSYLIPIGIIALCAGSIYIMLFSSYFQVRQIECQQDVAESCQNQFVTSELETLKGQNLFLLSDHELRTRLMQGDPTIREITLVKTIPNKVTLNVQSVYPVIALSTQDSSSHLILSDDYVVIRTSQSNPNIPIARYDQPLSLRVGQKIEDQDLRQILSACVELASAFPGTTEITITGRDLGIRLNRGQSAVFTINRPVDEQIIALRTILLDATIREGATQFDVRYKQPIIR